MAETERQMIDRLDAEAGNKFDWEYVTPQDIAAMWGMTHAGIGRAVARVGADSIAKGEIVAYHREGKKFVPKRLKLSVTLGLSKYKKSSPLRASFFIVK